MSSVGAPDIERAFALSHAATAAILFVVPGVIALVVEPAIFLLADRGGRRWVIAGGAATIAAAALAAAVAPGPITLALAMGAMWIGMGTSSGLAQATLVDGAAGARGRALARWTLLSLLGDLASTAVMAALPRVGGTWRTAYALIAAVMLAWSVGLVGAAAARDDDDAPHADGDASRDDDDAARDDDDASRDDDDAPHADGAAAPPGLWRALRDALADRALLRWLFATALCDLLDEILVVFASIHLRDDLGASPLVQSLAIAAMLAGGGSALVALDRVLERRDERTVLTACAIACAIAYAAWLAAPTAGLAALLLVPVGATATPLYPLAQARAYARRPGGSGAVQAASHLFTPLGLALPLGIGVIADHAGTWAALAVLIVQPIGLAALAAADRS